MPNNAPHNQAPQANHKKKVGHDQKMLDRNATPTFNIHDGDLGIDDIIGGFKHETGAPQPRPKKFRPGHLKIFDAFLVLVMLVPFLFLLFSPQITSVVAGLETLRQQETESKNVSYASTPLSGTGTVEETDSSDGSGFIDEGDYVSFSSISDGQDGTRDEYACFYIDGVRYDLTSTYLDFAQNGWTCSIATVNQKADANSYFSDNVIIKSGGNRYNLYLKFANRNGSATTLGGLQLSKVVATSLEEGWHMPDVSFYGGLRVGSPLEDAKPLLPQVTWENETKYNEGITTYTYSTANGISNDIESFQLVARDDKIVEMDLYVAGVD